MDEVRSAEEIKGLTKVFLDRGFAFEYTYQKGGDSSCVYVYRFRKGKDYFDWRETSGTYEIHLVVCVDGQFAFPDLYKKYKKESRAFAWKHLFRPATIEEKREFFASLLVKELTPDGFYGIKI